MYPQKKKCWKVYEKKIEPVIDIKSNDEACEKFWRERKTVDYKRNWLILNGLSNFHGHGQQTDTKGPRLYCL